MYLGNIYRAGRIQLLEGKDGEEFYKDGYQREIVKEIRRFYFLLGIVGFL